jgi:GNAT superfamily N-acetyltransferase
MPSAELHDLSMREITPEDAGAAANLSEQLGYPVSAAVMQKRIESLARIPNRVIYVACLDGEVVGWIDVGVTNHLQVDPRAEIGGLVVSDSLRSSGIGRRLVALAEAWALQKGFKVMVVRSNIAREEAHKFYLREGYARAKTSAVFTKTLG